LESQKGGHSTCDGKKKKKQKPEEIMAVNLQNLTKGINLQIKEAKQLK
jgi:hypothetical protein